MILESTSTGVTWEQFKERYPQIKEVHDVNLFDLIDIPEGLTFTPGLNAKIKVRDDGTFGNKDHIGVFRVREVRDGLDLTLVAFF